MKMSIAKALKEKNRLVGKINQVRSLLNAENIKTFSFQIKDGEQYNEEKLIAACDGKRKVDVKALEAEWKTLEERLIRLKVAIQKANSGAIETLVRLQEAKSHLTQIDSIRYGESGISENFNGRVIGISAALGQEYELAEKTKYTNLVNELQDKIDEYNATTQVEVAD